PIRKRLRQLLRTHDVYLVPGGGPAWDPRKQWRRRYKTPIDHYRTFARENLRMNAIELATAFHPEAYVCEPRDFAQLLKPQPAAGRLPILYWAPQALLAGHEEDAEYSDVHTLLMANNLATSHPSLHVIFAKATHGVFEYDHGLTTKTIDKLLAAK